MKLFYPMALPDPDQCEEDHCMFLVFQLFQSVHKFTLFRYVIHIYISHAISYVKFSFSLFVVRLKDHHIHQLYKFIGIDKCNVLRNV